MVVVDYINTMKTTFDFKFDLYQTFKQHECTKNGNKEKLSKKTQITRRYVIREKLVNNKNNKKSSSLY